MLAGADERGGSLELLDREQPERVAHQHGHTDVVPVPVQRCTEPTVPERERGETEIGLRRAATRREPQEVGHIAMTMTAVDERSQVDQDERDLERSPSRRGGRLFRQATTPTEGHL